MKKNTMKENSEIFVSCFWNNALKYAEENRKVNALRKCMGSRYWQAKEGTCNITLEKVYQVLDALEINDWEILFR